jgi:uncharacterized protein
MRIQPAKYLAIINLRFSLGKFSLHKVIILFTGILLAPVNHCAAQTKEDVKIVSGLIEVPHYEVHFRLHREENIMQGATQALFVFYKNFISSQDGSHCSFYPSCSQYAIQSIRKKGFFVGLLNAFDRLTRCNGLCPENYTIVPGTHQLYDPVE